jgi:hypothetical protein
MGSPEFKTVQQFENTVEIQDINRIIALLNVHWFFFILALFPPKGKKVKILAKLNLMNNK